MQTGASFKYQDTVEEMIHTGLMEEGVITGAMPDFDKPAGHKCPHQSHSKGCKVYDKRPMGCRLWECRWLAEDDTADLPRPDRCHYVIDISPDFVTWHDEKGKEETIPVIQIWVDSGYRDAYKDEALRRYMIRRNKEGYAFIIRFDNMYDSVFVHYQDGKWYEKSTNTVEHEHSAMEKAIALKSKGIKLNVIFK
jgi:hypothetical protein